MRNLNGKKNLIFDVGDVLIGYRWKEMLTDDFGLADEKAEMIGRRVFEDPVWADFDRGNLSVDELVDHYCGRWPEESATIRRFFYGDDLMATRREAVWDRVDKLKKKGYGIFILSNYSEYLFKKHTHGMPIPDMTDGGVISYQVGMIKPEEGIYKALLDKYGLDPAQCLFFDDRAENAIAAKELGMSAVTISSESMLLEELDKLIKGL